MQILQRPDWYGETKELGHLFRLRKAAGHSFRYAVCRLFSHQLGWELRLEVNDALVSSQVCRTEDQVLTTGEQWKTGMVEKGWL